ncbi:hypothetical protein M23134_07489 [Microscilla marina ATCC 23134]|uniref:Uncharacterized protein n=1 Tax=Microscilla marina ATCC 23134 TaxID=313606 RepID=A1ZEX8_MICM2|nr:hypothetical protein M23134_07489 [Microscilla marina ATCC 23134]
MSALIGIIYLQTQFHGGKSLVMGVKNPDTVIGNPFNVNSFYEF